MLLVIIWIVTSAAFAFVRQFYDANNLRKQSGEVKFFPGNLSMLNFGSSMLLLYYTPAYLTLDEITLIYHGVQWKLPPNTR
jgi:hypothetical protein